jgi:hypothetical protein
MLGTPEESDSFPPTPYGARCCLTRTSGVQGLYTMMATPLERWLQRRVASNPGTQRGLMLTACQVAGARQTEK